MIGMRNLVFGAVFAALAFSPSQASPVTFKYVGPGCVDHVFAACSAVGVSPGTVPDFTMTIDSSKLKFGVQVLGSDILDFSVKLGSFSITKATAAGILFDGFLNSSLTAFDLTKFDWTFFASKSIGPTLGDSFLAADENLWVAGRGSCANTHCTTGSISPLAQSPQFEPSNLIRVNADEPASLAVFGVTFILLSLARRRKRAAS